MYMYSSKPKPEYTGRDSKYVQRPRQRQPDLENEDILNSNKIISPENVLCAPLKFPDSSVRDEYRKSERMYSTGFIGRSGLGDHRATYQQTPEEPSLGRSRRDVYRNDRRTGDSYGNSTREEYGDSSESRPVESYGGVVNGNTRGLSDDRPFGASDVFYGYGGPFRLDADSDRNTDISDTTENLSVQPWMDKISGGTFKRNYLDRVSFRVSLIYCFNEIKFRHNF